MLPDFPWRGGSDKMTAVKSKEGNAMKLSKKSSAIQRSIRKAIASGKALGGLLVGLAAAVAGCREHHSHASTMGRFPDPRYQENATNETRNRRVVPGEPPVAQPGETNTATECKTGDLGRKPRDA